MVGRRDSQLAQIPALMKGSADITIPSYHVSYHGFSFNTLRPELSLEYLSNKKP